MGTSYRYKCQGCGYEREYYIGGGFLSTEYYEKCKRGEEMLRAAVEAGEYGEVLKTLVDMGKEDFEFSCDEELMQCNNCFQISTILKKRISLWDRDSGFHIEIGFDEPCPFCGKKVAVIWEDKHVGCLSEMP